MTHPEGAARTNRLAAFRHRAFALYWTARFLTTFGAQILSMAVGWQIYDMTGQPLYLGLVGLVQFAPALLLVLVTGAAADRFGRRFIMRVATSVMAACALALLLLAWSGLAQPMAILGVLLAFGVGRAFLGPASASLVVNLVPREDFPAAVALNSTAWQTASTVGPIIGGLLYGLGELDILGGALKGHGAEAAYLPATVMISLGVLLLSLIRAPENKATTQQVTTSDILAGFRFIFSEKVVLGAISLDLFAVLLGGAVALMPVFARDILELGPLGLGMLRAAPGVGAILMAAWLTGHPIRNHAGLVMFAGVALFGLFTVVFGYSRIGWLSIAALALLGAADMISVVIRETLLQLWTPDNVRGRVNAVNSVFVGASNELGEFRAGMMATWIGAAPAVIIGGFGAILVAGAWAVMFPQLRKARSLSAAETT